MAGKKQVQYDTSLVTQYFDFKVTEQVKGVNKTMASVVKELCELSGKKFDQSRAYDWLSGKYSPPVLVQRIMIDYTLKRTLQESSLINTNGELTLTPQKMRRLAQKLLPPPRNLERKLLKNPQTAAAKQFQKGLLKRIAKQKKNKKKTDKID